MGRGWSLAIALTAVGCAGSTGGTRAPAESPPIVPAAGRHAASTATAQRIYALAEQRYAEGDYPAAVALFRRALLQLPETEAADVRRHGLVLRIGHTQLRAWLQTGDDAYLYDAQRMLLRYADLHTALFGDADAAQRERTEVWALLGQVELRLDEPQRMAIEDAAAERHARADRKRAADGAVPDVADDHRGEPVDGDIVREVVVERRRLATLDDPRVEARLRSDYSSAEAGLVLTRSGGGEALHGARGLVRVHRPPTATVEDPPGSQRRLARRLGYQVIRAARPALRRCYEDALAREAALVADSTVEVSVGPDGRVGRVRIVDGQLVDALGDVCLLEQLERARLGEEAPPEPVRVRVALRFLFQDAVYPDGRRSDTPGANAAAKPNEPPKGPMISAPALDVTPGIEDFAY